jgi:transposase InsO family protein
MAWASGFSPNRIIDGPSPSGSLGKQPKRGRLWPAGGSCIRLRPQQRNHVWSYDFVEDRTHDGRKYRMLNVLDEFTHECLAIRVARELKAIDVIDVLSDLFILRGVPGHIRSDNGPEFLAEAVQQWIAAVGAKTAYIERGSPWENGYVESFNVRLRAAGNVVLGVVLGSKGLLPWFGTVRKTVFRTKSGKQ